MIGFYVFYLFLYRVLGQLSSRESLLTTSTCNINNATLDCGADAVIAVQTVRYGYRSTCGTACCQYNVTDCLVNASNRQDIIEFCSGHSSCNVPTQQTHDFCSFGTVTASYVYLEFFCIQKSRITGVCSSSSVVSTTGEPLYLTNEGYPGITIGTMTCTCSFEAQSCLSAIQIYVIQADLFLDTSNCQQTVNFTNSEGMTLDTIACESYYDNFITESSLSSNYIQIKFVSNSTQNREGRFFIGLTASEPNTSVTLICSRQPAAWCIDCGTPAVAYGIVALNSDTSAGATANVTCYPSFQTDTPVITCRPTGLWDNATCSQMVSCLTDEWQCDNGQCIKYYYRCDNIPDCIDVSDEKNCQGDTCSEGHILCKNSTVSYCSLSICDCGQPMHLVNGIVTLNNKTDTNAGATANISCDSGFETTKATIWCQTGGLWETSLCVPVDCGYPTTIENGYITLQRTNATTYGSSANVRCTTNYQSIRKTILCLASGEWETAMCIIIDEKEKDDPVITGIIGAVSGIAATVVVGAMVFLLQKIYRKRKESTKRTVASPDTSNADAVRNYEQLQPVTRIDESDHYHELASVTGTGRF